MTLGEGRRRLGLLLATTLVAAGAVAGSGMPLSSQVGPARDLGVQEGGRLDKLAAAEVNTALLRDLTYQHVKGLGLPSEEAFAALDEIDARAWHGEVADDAIERATWIVMDRQFSEKIAIVLRQYAETVAFGSSTMAVRAPAFFSGETDILAPVGDDVPTKGGSLGDGNRTLGVGGSDEMGLGIEEFGVVEGPLSPVYDPLTHIPGCGDAADTTCPACSVTGSMLSFACVTPTCTPTSVCGDLPNNTDCSWHCFVVTEGESYKFDTCLSDANGNINTQLFLFTQTCTAIGGGSIDSCGTAIPPRNDTVTYTHTDPSPGIQVANIYLRVNRVALGSLATSHTYTLTYQRTSGCPPSGCSTCLVPIPPAQTPTNACQCLPLSQTDAACPSDFYSFNLTANTQVKFTLCPGTCALADANFDSLMRLFGPPAGCGGAAVATNNDAGGPCGLRSEIIFNVPAGGTGVYVLEITGQSIAGVPAVGDYRLCFIDTSCAGSCAAPNLGTLTPSCSACQSASGSVTACQDNWYTVNLTAGQRYIFSTTSNAACSPACSGTIGGGLDSVLELFTPACLLVASNDDCTAGEDGSYVDFVVPAVPAGTQAYRLHVSGFLGTTGSYTLGYRCITTCTPPSNTTVAPSGTFPTNAADCKRTQTFLVGASGTTPITFSYNIVPISGSGSASPSGANFVSATGSGSFSTTFTNNGCGPVTYRVNVTATNACGSHSAFADFTLEDKTPPVVTPPPNAVVDCSNVPAATNATATDNCDPNPNVQHLSDTTLSGTCAGNYTILRRYQATDCNGNVSLIATQLITVLDTTPPTVEFTDDVIACLWSPNHDYLCLDLAALDPQGSDDCSPAFPGTVTFTLGGIMSSECDDGPCDTTDGNGDGSFVNDICPVASEILGQQTFCIRSERMGTGPGRTYSVFVIAQDDCGNSSPPTAIGKILVPHDTNDHFECLQPTDGKICAEAVCDNGIDGDGDLLVDCDDPDCDADPTCTSS